MGSSALGCDCSARSCEPACSSFTASYYSSLFQFCKQHEREAAICGSGGGEAGGAGFRFSGVRRNRQRCCRTERLGWGMKEAAERLSKPWAKTFPLLLGNVISQPEEGVMTRCLQMSFGQTQAQSRGSRSAGKGEQGGRKGAESPASPSSPARGSGFSSSFRLLLHTSPRCLATPTPHRLRRVCCLPVKSRAKAQGCFPTAWCDVERNTIPHSHPSNSHALSIRYTQPCPKHPHPPCLPPQPFPCCWITKALCIGTQQKPGCLSLSRCCCFGLLTNAHSARGSPLVRTGPGTVGVRIKRVYL